MIFARLIGLGGVLGVLAIGCAPKDAGFGEVRTLVHDRSGRDVNWRHVDGRAAVDADIEKLLAAPLTADAAVQLALLNNPDLEASFEQLGIQRAALVDASLLPNPELEGEALFADGEDQADLELGASIDLGRILFTSLRRGVAHADLAAAKVAAAGAALDLAYSARVAFYDYQAAQQLVEVGETVLRAAAGSYELAKQLREAGNISKLDLALERTLYEEARLAVADAQTAAFDARQALAQLMGITGAQTEWTVEGRLADPPAKESSLAGLQQRAVASSLELVELEYQYMAAARRAKVARAEGLLPKLHAGVVAEREEGRWSVGPSVELEVPLFDQGQGGVGAARATMRMLQRTYDARVVQVETAVTSARNRVVVARQRVEHFQDNLMPVAETILEQTLLQYNAMNADVFRLIDAKRNQIQTARRYIGALRDYWRARATLDQLLAGRLTTPSSSDAMNAGGATPAAREDH